MNNNYEELSLDKIMNILADKFPDHIIVESSDYESDSKETYKYLYEKTYDELCKCKESLHITNSDKEYLERDYIELKNEYESDKKLLDLFGSDNKNLIDFINHYINSDITISDFEVLDSDDNIIKKSSHKPINVDKLSDNPGVYNFTRTSWFTPLKNELSKKNIINKNIANTQEDFVSRLLLFKGMSKKNYIQKAASKYEKERKHSIAKILMYTGSNEEKYLKYILVTPGMSKEIKSILFSASELGLDANVIIELLEQPEDTFNIDVLKAFVSEVRKGTEYNLKQELAEELIKGDWYISVNENGISKKLQLVPIEEINEIKEQLVNISNHFNNNINNKINSISKSPEVELSSTTNIDVLDETAEPDVIDNDLNDEEIYPFIYEENNNSDNESNSSLLNFDESMI